MDVVDAAKGNRVLLLRRYVIVVVGAGCRYDVVVSCNQWGKWITIAIAIGDTSSAGPVC
jgi:hypothetical protein